MYINLPCIYRSFPIRMCIDYVPESIFRQNNSTVGVCIMYLHSKIIKCFINIKIFARCKHTYAVRSRAIKSVLAHVEKIIAASRRYISILHCMFLYYAYYITILLYVQALNSQSLRARQKSALKSCTHSQIIIALDFSTGSVLVTGIISLGRCCTHKTIVIEPNQQMLIGHWHEWIVDVLIQSIFGYKRQNRMTPS